MLNASGDMVEEDLEEEEEEEGEATSGNATYGTYDPFGTRRLGQRIPLNHTNPQHGPQSWCGVFKLVRICITCIVYIRILYVRCINVLAQPGVLCTR